MPIFVRFGLGLGAAVFVWQLIAAAVMPGTSAFIPVATGIEASTLILLFSRPGPGRPMGPRIAVGAGTALVGAVCAFLGSLLVSEVLFPGLLATLPGSPSAISAAGGGFMGTLVTGAALSAALAFVQRDRVVSQGG